MGCSQGSGEKKPSGAGPAGPDSIPEPPPAQADDPPEPVAPAAGGGERKNSRPPPVELPDEVGERKVSWGHEQVLAITPKGKTPPPRTPPPPRAANQSSAGVRMDFEEAQGEVVTKLIEYKPLGFTFDKQMPIVVDHVVAHSVAEELGIKPGWTLVQIGDRDITSAAYIDVFHLLQDKLGSLPKKPKRALGGGAALDHCSKASLASARGLVSMRQFAEPHQTLIFCDWDDTLFPTTEITDRWKLPYRDSDPMPQLTPEQKQKLDAWESALASFLEEVEVQTLRCTVVTAARKGWIDTCVERFGPKLKRFFAEDRVRVVYAMETSSDVTRGKCAAMTAEAKDFYSQYNNQSWKNILSMGDMPMERDALRRLAAERSGTKHERLRTKTILLPTDPSLSEITLRLRFDTVMIATFVRFDGDFNIDLKADIPPLKSFAEALDVPFLADVDFPGHAWGRGEAPKEAAVEAALSQLLQEVEGPPEGFDEGEEDAHNDVEQIEEANI